MMVRFNGGCDACIELPFVVFINKKATTLYMVHWTMSLALCPARDPRVGWKRSFYRSVYLRNAYSNFFLFFDPVSGSLVFVADTTKWRL